MLWDCCHNVIRFCSWNGRVPGGRIVDVFDCVEKRHEGANSNQPGSDPFWSRNILAVKIQGQFWSASVVKQTIVIFHQLERDHAQVRFRIPQNLTLTTRSQNDVRVLMEQGFLHTAAMVAIHPSLLLLVCGWPQWTGEEEERTLETPWWNQMKAGLKTKATLWCSGECVNDYRGR